MDNLIKEIGATLDGMFGTRQLMIMALAGDHSALQDADMNITGLIASVERIRDLASPDPCRVSTECAFGGGRYMPAMFAKAEDELSFREMKLIAASHGYGLKVNVIDVDEEIVEGGEFPPMFEAAAPPLALDEGWILAGAWDNEDGQVCACYLRPIRA
jgi:hypothetical protein